MQINLRVDAPRGLSSRFRPSQLGVHVGQFPERIQELFDQSVFYKGRFGHDGCYFLFSE